jgi:DnaJ family protein C protein 3
MLFYSVGDTDKGIEQMRKCLRSDPDSKACSKLFRREKQIDKTLKQVSKLIEKRQFNSAVKLLVPTGEDPGLLQEVKDEVNEGRAAGHIHKNAPNDLYASLVEMACECYSEVRLCCLSQTIPGP